MHGAFGFRVVQVGLKYQLLGVDGSSHVCFECFAGLSVVLAAFQLCCYLVLAYAPLPPSLPSAQR